MFGKQLRWPIVGLIGLSLFLASCTKLPEKRHPLVLKAKQAQEKGNYPEAAKFYEQYLLKQPTSFQIHQDVATIYFDYLNEPFMAAYHYRQSMRYQPRNADTSHLKQWLTAAEQKLFNELKNEYSDATADKVKELKEHLFKIEKQNDKLKRWLTHINLQNKKLKRQLDSQINPPLKVTTTIMKTQKTISTAKPDTESKPQVKPPQPKPATSHPATPPAGSRFYIVKKGDNLSRISRQVYGSSKHYRIIFDANRGILPSMSQLSLGQRLVIPPLPKGEMKGQE